MHFGPDDRSLLQRHIDYSRAWKIPLVAAGDVHYHVPDRMLLCDVLAAIREGITVSELRNRPASDLYQGVFPNAERHLRRREQLQVMYAAFPDALEHTRVIADRCRFSLEKLRYEYPEELVPTGQTPMEYLRDLDVAGCSLAISRQHPDQSLPPRGP